MPRRKKEYASDTAGFMPGDTVMQRIAYGPANLGHVLGTRGGRVCVQWRGTCQTEFTPPALIRPYTPPAPPRPKRQSNRTSFAPGPDARRHTFTRAECVAGYDALVEKYVASGKGEYAARRYANALIRYKEEARQTLAD